MLTLRAIAFLFASMLVLAVPAHADDPMIREVPVQAGSPNDQGALGKGRPIAMP